MPAKQVYYCHKSEEGTSLVFRRTAMTPSKETKNNSPLRRDWDTPRAGEKNRRGAEKPGLFFSVYGAPYPALPLKNQGGFSAGTILGRG